MYFIGDLSAARRCTHHQDAAIGELARISVLLRGEARDRLRHPIGKGRNARDIAAAMTADLGGEQELTEAQRQLIQRAATLGALIEDFEARFLAGEQLDGLPKYLSAITTQRHVLSLLGLERRAHDATPDIQKFLAAMPDKAKSAS